MKLLIQNNKQRIYKIKFANRRWKERNRKNKKKNKYNDYLVVKNKK